MPGARATVLRAEQKARQLALAVELGFEIPPTLITNSPEEFLAFYREHDGRIVSKPVHNGGVWADRHSRKLLIMGADAAIAVSTLALALIMMSGYDAVWLIFLTMAVRSLNWCGASLSTTC